MSKTSFLLKLSPSLMALSLVIGAAALTGCATTDDPYTRLENRVSTAAAMGNNTVTNSLSTVRCPAGMIPDRDQATVRSDADVRYREDHGRGGGRSINNGPNSFRPYGSASVQVRANADASGRRTLKCVVPPNPISLSLPSERR